MADTISVRFSKDLQKDIARIEKKWQTDRSEVIRRLILEAVKEWKLKNAIEEIRAHNLSIGKAAEECEVSIYNIINILRDSPVDWTGYSKEDFENDLKIIK